MKGHTSEIIDLLVFLSKSLADDLVRERCYNHATVSELVKAFQEGFIAGIRSLKVELVSDIEMKNMISHFGKIKDAPGTREECYSMAHIMGRTSVAISGCFDVLKK